MCRDHQVSFKMKIEDKLLEFTECNFSYSVFKKFEYGYHYYIYTINIHVLEKVKESKKNLEIIKKYFSENKYTISIFFTEDGIIKIKNPYVTITNNGIELRTEETKNIKRISFDKSYMRKYKIKKIMDNV